jgi:uncharacterized lipoprotein YajG
VKVDKMNILMKLAVFVLSLLLLAGCAPPTD